MADKYLKDLPVGKMLGKWQFSVAQNGFITSEIFLEVNKIFFIFLEMNKIFLLLWPAKFKFNLRTINWMQ